MNINKLVPGSKVEIIKGGNMGSMTRIGDRGTTVGVVNFYKSGTIPDVAVRVNDIDWWIEIDALKVIKYGDK